MQLLRHKATIFITRFSLYGLISVMLTLYGLGKIKDMHEGLAIDAMRSAQPGKGTQFSLMTPIVAIYRDNSGYYRELAADQLGSYQTHSLLHWTVDVKSFLSSGSLPIELYYQSHYERGQTLQNIRVEGVFKPRLVSHSMLLE